MGTMHNAFVGGPGTVRSLVCQILTLPGLDSALTAVRVVGTLDTPYFKLSQGTTDFLKMGQNRKIKYYPVDLHTPFEGREYQEMDFLILGEI